MQAINKLAIGLAITVLAAIGIKQASADTILISDDFNRGSNTPLKGSAVPTYDPTMYPSGLTWIGAGGGHNNTTAGIGEVGGWIALVPFTPQASQQYRLTLVTGTTIQNSLELAFASHSGGFGDYDLLNQDVSSMSSARLGPQVLDGYPGVYADYGNFTNPGGRTETPFTPPANSGNGYVTTMSILMDTSAGLANSSFTLSVNGNTIGSWTGNASTYNYVGFGRGTTPQDPNGTVITSFSLTQVPEPGSLTLLGLLGGAMLLRRKLRKA